MKRVTQLSLDVIVPDETDSAKLNEWLKIQLEKFDYPVLGTTETDMTEYYGINEEDE